jgi:hypothetical protein
MTAKLSLIKRENYEKYNGKNLSGIKIPKIISNNYSVSTNSQYSNIKNKLVQFYKRFGFKLNKGIYKNYEYMDTMIRYPKINQMSETKLFIKELVKEYLNKQK